MIAAIATVNTVQVRRRAAAAEHNQGSRFMKACFIGVAVLSVLLSASEAPAQMTVDVAKITCRQYLFDRTFSPRAPMIANWLSGYFNGQKNNTVVDLGAMAKNKDKVEDYCRMNQDATLVEAAKSALGLPK
jgi:HdeA/HdeB family